MENNQKSEKWAQEQALNHPDIFITPPLVDAFIVVPIATKSSKDKSIS